MSVGVLVLLFFVFLAVLFWYLLFAVFCVVVELYAAVFVCMRVWLCCCVSFLFYCFFLGSFFVYLCVFIVVVCVLGVGCSFMLLCGDCNLLW